MNWKWMKCSFRCLSQGSRRKETYAPVLKMRSFIRTAVYFQGNWVYWSAGKAVKLLATRNYPFLENAHFTNKKVGFKLLLSFICISSYYLCNCSLNRILPKEPVSGRQEKKKKLCGKAGLLIRNTPVCLFWLRNFNSDERVVSFNSQLATSLECLPGTGYCARCWHQVGDR